MDKLQVVSTSGRRDGTQVLGRRQEAAHDGGKAAPGCSKLLSFAGTQPCWSSPVPVQAKAVGAEASASAPELLLVPCAEGMSSSRKASILPLVGVAATQPGTNGAWPPDRGGPFLLVALLQWLLKHET